MARAAQLTRPIEALHNAVRSLEAAAFVCLSSPKRKPVHQLRTWTRRIEALVELIALLPDAPPVDQPGSALKLLKKIRREAGRVRDLDVERDLVAQEAARAKGSRASLAIRKESRKLRRELKRRRKNEAEVLLALLEKLRKKLPRALKDLSGAFAAMKEATLTEEKLLPLIRDWYGYCNPPSSWSGSQTEALHAIRQRAKHARYMAESAPDSATRAHRLAARFEQVQGAGGRWHDWLQTCQAANNELGKSAQLPQRFATRAQRALRSYKEVLGSPILR